MPVLSNGQVIGISSERARYHATRRNIRISRQTPHSQLYPLVDVILADTHGKPAGGQDHYHFTGHTLADQVWLNSLPEPDRRCLLAWLDDPATRYEIEGARRRLIYDDLPAAIESHPYPARLYSSLRKLVQAMPVTAMSARQWRQTLLNLRRQGIRQEELIWSGVMAYLAEQEHGGRKKISKQALLAGIDFSGIRLAMTNELTALNHQGRKPVYRARYRHVSLFGGEDYREWLLTLPDYLPSHFGSHFTERNILLHIRTKTRVDSRGRKLLFIEEIQSDWHQAGIKNANPRSRVEVPPAPFRKEWLGLGLKLMLLHASETGLAGLAWADGDIQSARYRIAIPSLRRLYDKEIAGRLLGLSRHWQGVISATELESKAPALRVTRLRAKRDHEFIKLPDHHKPAVSSVLACYAGTISLRVPVFIIPAAMACHMLREGLPLFGDRIIADVL